MLFFWCKENDNEEVWDSCCESAPHLNINPPGFSVVSYSPLSLTLSKRRLWKCNGRWFNKWFKCQKLTRVIVFLHMLLMWSAMVLVDFQFSTRRTQRGRRLLRTVLHVSGSLSPGFFLRSRISRCGGQCVLSASENSSRSAAWMKLQLFNTQRNDVSLCNDISCCDGFTAHSFSKKGKANLVLEWKHFITNWCQDTKNTVTHDWLAVLLHIKW